MGERQTIIVAGAGIGGLTTALSLADAGFDVTVCERTEELAEIGAGIQLSPNAGRILSALGLDEAIGAIAVEPAAIDVWSGVGGNLIVSVPTSRFRERYGAPYRVIHRPALQSALAAAVRQRSGIDLRLGTRVGESRTEGAGVVVRLGNETVAASGLIGADGVWSTTRAGIPGASEPLAAGRTAWRATVRHDDIPDSLAGDHVGLWLGQDAHLVHYPVADGGAINLVAIVAESWEQSGWNAPGDPTWIAKRFADWPAAAKVLVDAPSAWQKWALAAVDPAGPWTSGPLALLGDAAHAMMPFLAQGAAMAIEDAAVLAGCLATAPRDVPGAFRAYERERKPRVSAIAAAAHRTGDAYHFGKRLAGMRDLALRAAGPALIMRRNDWIYRWRPPFPPGS